MIRAGFRFVSGFVLGCLLLAASPVRAQSASASIQGSVRDMGGAPVAGALVQARAGETGAVRTAVTDAGGRYVFSAIPPGDWTLVARSPEGVLSESATVTLRLQQTGRVDLRIGSGLVEEVTVSAAAPLVDPTRVQGELRITSVQTGSIPLAGRNVADLSLLDSAVRPTPPGNFYGERGSVFVINGQSGRSNSFLVDGLDNNDQASGTSLNSYFSQLVVAEFVVLKNQYAAEFGRASGGILNIVTERGTNENRYEVFAQGTSSSWNSSGSFVGALPNPGEADAAVARSQTGFKLGGPIVRDRSFWFLAYEHQTADDPTPFTGVDRSGVAGGFTVAPNRSDSLFFRTDFELEGGKSLMFRLSGDDRKSDDLNVGGVTTPESGFALAERDFQFASSFLAPIGGTLVNEVRFLAGRSEFDQSANSSRPGVERPSGIFGGNNLNAQQRNETRFQIVENLTWQRGAHTFKFGGDVTYSSTDVEARFNPQGNFIYRTDEPFDAGDSGDLNVSDAIRNQGTCSANPSFSCLSDGECRAVGAGYCLFQPIPCPGTEGVDDDGDGIVDEPCLLGTYPQSYQLIDGEPVATLRDTRVSLFAQDSWQATPRLLLDYGLRYDVGTFTLPPSARVESTIPNGGAGRDQDNVAPRFGFSWNPKGDGRIVMRGGAGMFYDKLVLAFPAVAAVTSETRINVVPVQGFTVEWTEDYIEEVGVDTIREVIEEIGTILQPLVLRFSTGTELDTPYAVQANVGVEGAVGRGGAWSANLLRSRGYHTPLMKDLNPIVGYDNFGVPGIPRHVDDSTGSIAAIVTEGRTWYWGLDLGWRWQGQGGGWHSISYTLSRSEDLGPDPLKGGIYLPPNPLPGESFSFASERGRSDHDRRHRLVIAGETGLPWGMRVSGVVQLMSAAPWNVTTGRDDDLNGITTDRPAGVGRNTGSDTPLDAVNDLRASVGLDPVTDLESPSFAQVDVRLSRRFALSSRRTTAEAFFQVFNVFDRFNGGPVEGRVTAQNFGRPVGLVGPPRTVEVGLRFLN